MPDQVRNMPLQQREARLLPNTFNAESRTIDVVWTTGARVRRYDYWNDLQYDEELVVDPTAIDMTRMESGNAPVLDNHRVYGGVGAQIGVVTRAWLDGGEGHATVRLSARDDVAGIVADIRDGIIRNISVGYSVQRYQIDQPAGEIPIYRAVEWRPHEISFVTVPADAGATVRSANQHDQGSLPCVFTRAQSRTTPENDMPNATSAAPAADRADEGATTTTTTETPANDTASTQVVVAGDAARSAEIFELATRHGFGDRAAGWLREGRSIDQVRTLILDARAAADEAAGGHRNRVEAGADEADKQRGAVVDSIMARAMIINPATKRSFALEGANPYRGYSLVDMARRCLERAGVRTEGMSKMDLVGRAFTQSSSDFPVILENAMHKALQAGYAVAADTWQRWCATGTVADFRAHNRYRLGSLGNLDALTELGEFRNKSIPDGEKATIKAGTKGNIINLSRQAVINDDLSAFVGLSFMRGRAAARTIESDAYAYLASNPVMQDGFALFSTEHGNTASASEPSEASFDEGRQKMALQKDVGGNDYLDLRPAIWLGPVAKGGAARVVNDSQYSPDAVNKLQRPNTVRGMVRDVIDSPRVSSSLWYLLADPGEAPVIEVAFLEGEAQPFLDMEEGFSVDGTRFKVRLDFGIAAIDYRGAFRNG
jgi:hypothetical protein